MHFNSTFFVFCSASELSSSSTPNATSQNVVDVDVNIDHFDEKSPTSLSSESSDGLPPHEAYILPGKMKIGSATTVPALNSMHHSFATSSHLHNSSPKNHGFASSRSESIRSSSAANSDSFSFLHRSMKVSEPVGYFGSEADSERESISPPRLLPPHDEVTILFAISFFK